MQPPSASPLSTLHTRPTLLFKLRNWDDEASWHDFYRLYYNFVFGLARRSGLGHADAQDVAQDVFRRVAETIGDFETAPGRGSFRAWLANLTRWRIADRYRGFQPHERQAAAYPSFHDSTSTGTGTMDRIPDAVGQAAPWGNPAAEEHEWQHHLINAAMTRLAQRVPARHFQIFDLYNREDWSVFRISRELGVNPAHIYVINHRLTKQLKTTVDELKKQLNQH